MHRTTTPRPIVDPNRNPAIPMSDRAVVSALFGVIALLRIVYAFRYRIDSDEPQHLHVVWGWTQGLLPYRDLFDNHTPLFHMLFAPFLAVLGERPDILFLMRLAMVPLGIVILWSTYAIGRELFSSRVGLWAAALTGFVPSFFLESLEFRTDVLWSAFWFMALAVLVKGRLTGGRSFIIGVLLGGALSVSMKTVLLLVVLGMAVLGAIALTAECRSRSALSRLGLYMSAALVGLLSVPLSLTIFFVVHGAWTPFFYGIVQHNVLNLPGLSPWQKHPWRVILSPATVLLLCWAAWAVARRAPNAGIGARRVVIFLAAGLYFLAVHTVWPMFTAQDHLPFYPLFVILLTPSILAVPYFLIPRGRAILSSRPLFDVLSPVIVAVAEVGFLLTAVPLRHDGGDNEAALLTDVLRLTRPGDPVMDLKGETVFRPRPFYYVLETITKERMRRGLIADDIPERLIATRTCVAIAETGLFPPRARAFLQENYVSVGRLRVAGRLFASPVKDGSRLVPFEIQIPARYAMVSESGNASGRLDGRLYNGPRFLEAGHHEFLPSSGTGPIALIWAQAVERGYSPFAPQSRSL
ncbi:MAG: glycosyltransferase family 39 protein [Nitrospirae bacterium]|nr:glycosyltransferase family 39 protein [Nitrospirota bacterium]